MKTSFCGKMMANTGLQSSFFFQFCSQWLCRQLHHEEDRTALGLLAFFNRVGFFWYLLHVTGIEQNQASIKLLLNGFWHTNLATTVSHYFWQRAGVKGFKWIALGNLEQSCRRNVSLEGLKNCGEGCLSCGTPAGLSWSC